MSKKISEELVDFFRSYEIYEQISNSNKNIKVYVNKFKNNLTIIRIASQTLGLKKQTQGDHNLFCEVSIKDNTVIMNFKLKKKESNKVNDKLAKYTRYNFIFELTNNYNLKVTVFNHNFDKIKNLFLDIEKHCI